MSIISESWVDGAIPPNAPEITEDLLTGVRTLRRAFLGAPLHSVGGKTPVIRAGERGAGVHLIRRGFVLHSSILSDGRRSIVEVLVPGDVAGLEHIIAARPQGDFVAAIGRVGYNSLPAAAIRRLMDDKAVTTAVLALILEARSRIEQLATMVTRMDAREKVASFVLSIYRRLRLRGLINGLSFNLPLTQEQIADHLGLTLVHVNRILRLLREERLMHVDRGVVMILDFDGVLELLKGLPEPVYVPKPVMPEAD